MNNSIEQKIKNARVIASSYFILLGLINLFTNTLSDYQIIMRDSILLLVFISPALLHNKSVYLVFGSLGAIISLYIGIACLILNIQAYPTVNQISFLSGYALAIFTFTASSLYIYSSLDYSKLEQAV